MGSSDKIEIYVIVIETNSGVAIDLHYSSISLCRALRSKVFKKEWEECIIAKILQDLNKGKTISMNWLSGSRRIYAKKATTPIGINSLKDALLEDFINAYYLNKFTRQ